MKYSIDYLNNLTLKDFLKLISSLSDNELLDIINSNDFDKIDNTILKSLFLKSNNNIKKEILKNEILFDKLMNTSPNKVGKLLLELVDIDTLRLIVNSSYVPKYINKIIEYLEKIDVDVFLKITKEIDFMQIFETNSIFKDYNALYNYLVNEKKYDINISELFINRVKSGLNPLTLIRTSNEKELFILSKFNLIIKVQDSDENTITLSNGFSFDYNLLKKLYTKRVYTLSNLLLRHGNTNYEEVLVATIKLYSVFGFDNAFKIINNCFTQMTDSAITRIHEIDFKDLRREFRINNQNKFYYYGIEQNALEAITKNDVAFFLPFTFENNIDEANNLINELKKHIKEMTPARSEEYIKETLIKTIKKREQRYKDIHIKLTRTRINNKNPKYTVSAHELVSILGDVDDKFNLDEKGRSIPDLELQKFLLGNLKRDNDCLLRLIINKEAFGLNDTIGEVINKFDIFKEAVNKSKGKLSLNSVLDVIDISKVSLYDMKPDLQDITLATISKIIKSREYCTESENEIVKGVFQLHRARKWKIYSTIPNIKGVCDDIKYSVAPFDADYLLTAGIDAGNCLKVGALGEEFLKYCLTNKNGIIVYLYDTNGNIYVCPFVRSGNTIHCNGIDPKPEGEILESCLKALEEFAKRVCNESVIPNREHYNNIEMVTITDLHIFDYMNKSNYERFDLQETLPIDAAAYTDYNKKEIKNYVLYKSDTYSGSIYYVSNDKFYQPRNPIYKYNVLKEYDKERINIFVNSIAYSYIDYLPYSEEIKNILRDNYQLMDASSFRFIVGNKDWFIAIDSGLSLITYLLPYDDRAKAEYLDALGKVNELIKQFTDDDNKDLKKKSR